jgi:hypothetical protein
MSDAIADNAAIAFAETFYDAIAGGEHLRRAFDLGRNSISLQTTEPGDLPQLLTRKGIKPEEYDFLSAAKT